MAQIAQEKTACFEKSGLNAEIVKVRRLLQTAHSPVPVRVMSQVTRLVQPALIKQYSEGAPLSLFRLWDFFRLIIVKLP